MRKKKRNGNRNWKEEYDDAKKSRMNKTAEESVDTRQRVRGTLLSFFAAVPLPPLLSPFRRRRRCCACPSVLPSRMFSLPSRRLPSCPSPSPRSLWGPRSFVRLRATPRAAARGPALEGGRCPACRPFSSRFPPPLSLPPILPGAPSSSPACHALRLRGELPGRTPDTTVTSKL